MSYILDDKGVKNITTRDRKHLYDLYAKGNGYVETPPTIQEFISDEYYLGASLNGGDSVFPFWKQQLVDIYPTPFYETNKYKVVLLSGATGIGKCNGFNQELEFQMSDEDIKKYGLEEYTCDVLEP